MQTEVGGEVDYCFPRFDKGLSVFSGGSVRKRQKPNVYIHLCLFLRRGRRKFHALRKQMAQRGHRVRDFRPREASRSHARQLHIGVAGKQFYYFDAGVSGGARYSCLDFRHILFF